MTAGNGQFDVGGLVRRETRLASSVAKDVDEEAFLRRFNAILAAPHEDEYVEGLAERHASIHVIGVPRSGTTVATQLLTSCLDVGTVNNLIATFWRAPLYGVRLSKKLLGVDYSSGFASEHGRTTGIAEPHEFGYFWSSLLRSTELAEPTAADRDAIDWDRVRLVMLNMLAEFDRPVVFKSFHLMFHLGQMTAALPKTCFVWIRRDPVDTALSLLKLRRTYAADPSEWVGLAPREREWLQHESVATQVAGQVTFLESRVREQAEAHQLNLVEIGLEALREDPATALKRVQELLQRVDSPSTLRHSPPARFPHTPVAGPSAERDEVEAAFSVLAHRNVDG